MNRWVYYIHRTLFFVFGLLFFAFSGSIPAEASSVQRDIQSCTITLSQTVFSYNGQKCGPEVTVKDGADILTEGVDYNLYGATASSIGSHEITILGIGNYIGQATAVFRIQKEKNEIILDNKTYYTYSNPASYELYCYTNDDAKPIFSTKTKGVSITKDGVLTLKDGFLGSVKVTIRTPETEYYQAAERTFSVKFALKGTDISGIKGWDDTSTEPPENDHTVKVSWNTWDMSIQNVGGFQIRYSTDAAFRFGVYKTKIPMLNAFGSIVNACIMSKNMKKGDRMYFQIRTYKKALDGKTYYSAWSSAVSHKVDSSKKAFYKGKKPENGKTYSSDGILYQYKNKKLEAVRLIYPKYIDGHYRIEIPAAVSIYGKNYPVIGIKSGAFKNPETMNQADQIIIGKNVQRIGKNAFAGNRFVEKIIIKNKKLTLKSVGKDAFKNVGAIYVSTFRKPVKLNTFKNKRAIYERILRKRGLKQVQ